jgi:hypothetical protein
VIRLFYGSGSQEVQLLGKPMPDAAWSQIRQTVIRLLRAKRSAGRAAELLERIPFELRDGTNGFNDDFTLLYYSAPLDVYTAIAEQTEARADTFAYQDVAAAMSELGHPVRFIVVDLALDTGPPPVASPSLAITSDAVERALADAEQLLQSRGAPSSVDRIHTAFHGYLRAIATKAGLSVPPDAGATQLFKAIRAEHPALRAAGPRASDIDRIIFSMAAIIDALDPLRNRASGAHPNESVLGSAEAMLVVNTIKSLLHYLNERLR